MKYGVAMKLSAIAIVCAGVFCANAYAEDMQSQSSTNQAQTQSPEVTNKMLGNAFLTANQNKPGVVTLSDGLQYKVIVAGKGQKPTDTDVVTVHYAGTLINGKEFDSSYKRGEPASFPVNGVIPGWVEALKLMKTGSTWMLYIPSTLAYGEAGSPPAIGPNETLIFKVNLIEIKK